MPVRIQCTAPLHSRQNHETPKGPTGGGRQLSHSCAQNISGRSRFCIWLATAHITDTGGGAPGARSQQGTTVGRRKGASPTRCRWQKEPAHGSFWNPLSPQWDHLSLEWHGSFRELGLGGSGKSKVKGHKWEEQGYLSHTPCVAMSMQPGLLNNHCTVCLHISSLCCAAWMYVVFIYQLIVLQWFTFSHSFA